MRTIGLTCIGVTASAVLIAACSAGTDGSGRDLTGGNGGTSTGGTLSVGGSSASGGTGGATGGTGGAVIGQGGALSVGGASMGGSAGVPICQDFSVVPTKQIPTVMLLVDNSSSMFETMPPAWPILYNALMDPATGVVQALDAEIRFGFAAFKGSTTASTEDAAACAMWAKVEPAFDNRDAIDAAYKPITWSPGTKWETPTPHAINQAVADLTAYNPDPPGPKYILLVTDGNPNTCAALDPQCGQDLSIKAAQDAYAAGIGLFAMGIGDIVAQPNNGCPTSGRCGALHLQDLANAGIGAPVQPPPGCEDPADPNCQFKYAGCNPGNLLLATYTAAAPDVGVPFSVDTRNADAQTELVSTLTGLLANVISCTVEMDAVVVGNPASGIVTVGGSNVAYDDPDGWVLDMETKYIVTLQGAACEAFRGGGALDIKFPCVMDIPIVEPR
jgi:hypothetical protein